MLVNLTDSLFALTIYLEEEEVQKKFQIKGKQMFLLLKMESFLTFELDF